MQFTLLALALTLATGTFAAPSPRQDDGFNLKLIQPLTDSNKCLSLPIAASGPVTGNGAALVIRDCDRQDVNQHWEFGSVGSRTTITSAPHKNLCVDAGSAPPFFNGEKVQLWECPASSNPQTTWFFTDDQHIALADQNPGFCLDLTDGNTAKDNQLQIWNCDGSNNNQKWTVATVRQSPSQS